MFVRHGEGEHTLDPPTSLGITDPRLTARGRAQASRLKAELGVSVGDLVVVSPTRRTLETAALLVQGVEAILVVSAAVGPRMFPQDPRWSPLACDRLIERDRVAMDFPGVGFFPEDDEALWREGINTVALERFETTARALLAWCRRQRTPRALIFSHDGTIHCYRQMLGETGLTRQTFLGDAGWIKRSMP